MPVSRFGSRFVSISVTYAYFRVRPDDTTGCRGRFGIAIDIDPTKVEFRQFRFVTREETSSKRNRELFIKQQNDIRCASKNDYFIVSRRKWSTGGKDCFGNEISWMMTRWRSQVYRIPFLVPTKSDDR